MIAALVALALALLLILPLVALLLGFMFWIALFVDAWWDADMTSGWAFQAGITGSCAVIFTAAGAWGCWAIIGAIVATVS